MLFERNDVRVLEAFRGGDFDYVDAIGEVSEADFFRVITERKSWTSWPRATPLPASGTMCPCGSICQQPVHAFSWRASLSCLSFLVRCSSMIEAFGPAMATGHPSGDRRHFPALCGFNEKNDTIARPLATRTICVSWRGYRCAVTAELVQSRGRRNLKQHHALDAEGILLVMPAICSYRTMSTTRLFAAPFR